MLGGLFRGAAALFLFLLLSFGFEGECGGRLGLPLQALAVLRRPLLALALDGSEPHAFFVVRTRRGGFGRAQHPLALGGLVRGAPLLFFL